MNRHPRRRALLRLTAPLGALLAAALAGWAAPGPAPAPRDKPNLLLITVDTLRADRVGAYGGALETPQIDRLAARGTVFRRAFAQATTTLASHTTMLLGLTPLRHGVHDNTNFLVGEEFLTLAEILKAAGYATAAFIGGFPLDSRFGLGQGFDVYDETLENRGTVEKFYRERSAEKVVASAMGWLTGRQGPWFAWVHCYDPHDPYEPPGPFLAKYKDNPYDGEIAYVDDALKPLVDAIDANRWADDTVVVFTSDHGESLGQHGEDTHGFVAYNTTIWIPLVISAPGLPPGRTDQMAAHVDILPTVCDLLGIKTPPRLDGLSLLPPMKGKKLPKRSLYFESMLPFYSRGWAPLYGFIRGADKFIESPIPELYDLDGDFDELENRLAGGGADKWRAQLAKVTGELSPTDQAGREKKFDREVQERLRSLGYISTPQPVRKSHYGPADDVKTLLPFHHKCHDAQRLFELGRSEEAVGLLKGVLAEKEDFDGAYATLGVIYGRMGRVGDALTVLKKGIEVLPRNYLIASPYVHMLSKIGRYAEVIRVIAADGRYPYDQVADSWSVLGAAYLNTGDLDKARDSLNAALSLDERDYLSHRTMGDVEFAVYSRTGDRAAYERALESYERAIALNPRDPSSRHALGFTLLQGGRPGEAIAPLKAALDLAPDYPTAVYNLGLACLGSGDYEGALVHLTKFKERYGATLKPNEARALDMTIERARSKKR